MTNQELRARTAILPEFAGMAMNAGEQLQDAQLSKGFVPNELQPLVDEAITGAAPTFSDRPLTDLELSTLDTWFVAYPEKIAGTQIAGSGYIAPVRTRGNMEDLERVFAFLDEPLVQSSEFNVQSEPAKEDWMLTKDEFLQKERLTDSYPIKDSMWERNVFAKHRNEVAAVLRFQKDKENGAWVERSEIRTAIKEGRITAENAVKVIESAGLNVPEDISKLVLNSQTANQTVEQLREQEKAEYRAIDPTDSAKRKEIYDRYDKLITPLLMEQKKGFRTSFKNELGAKTDVFVLVPSDNATEFRVETTVHVPEGDQGIERLKIREKWFPIDQYDSFVADLKDRSENAFNWAQNVNAQNLIPNTQDLKKKAKAKAKALVLALELERERETM